MRSEPKRGIRGGQCLGSRVEEVMTSREEKGYFGQQHHQTRSRRRGAQPESQFIRWYPTKNCPQFDCRNSSRGFVFNNCKLTWFHGTVCSHADAVSMPSISSGRAGKSRWPRLMKRPRNTMSPFDKTVPAVLSHTPTGETKNCRELPSNFFFLLLHVMADIPRDCNYCSHAFGRKFSYEFRTDDPAV